MKLSGKVAIVTGGGRGLGRAYSRKLAGEGAALAVADVDVAAAERAVAEIGAGAFALEVDVTDEASVVSAVDGLLARMGRIDILVNNAGGGVRPAGPLIETSLELWNANLLLNLTSCFLVCRAVIPAMRAQGYGKIVNVTTGSIFSGATVSLFRPPETRMNLVAYVAAKGGVLGLTRALAREVGEYGIRVNAVAPGYTLTERSKRLMDERAVAAVVERQVFKRPGEPDDPAGAVLFLASPDSDFMTGQTICVDGGWVAH